MPKQPFETLILNGPKKREAYSLATTYHQVLQIMRVDCILGKFENKAGKILKDKETNELGFRDYLLCFFRLLP